VDDLLATVEDRYGVRLTIITGQVPPAKWHNHIGDPNVAEAVGDRFLHNAHTRAEGPVQAGRRDSLSPTSGSASGASLRSENAAEGQAKDKRVAHASEWWRGGVVAVA
jgi:hypothetical protein